MNPKRKPPIPIIDNLEFIGNPFKQSGFSSSCFLDTQVPGADLDLEYALKFLYSYNGSSATYNSYRREIERLLQWSWRINESSVMMLKREHIEEFIRFCFNPPKAWIDTKNVSRFKSKDGLRVSNSDWHPYVVAISK